jgi:uncharacterized membrane protein
MSKKQVKRVIPTYNKGNTNSLKGDNKLAVLGKFIVPENVFVILGLFFGLKFIYLIPPFQVPDESVHFKRVYKLSTFDIFQTETKGELVGDYMPSNLDSTPSHFSYLAFKPYNKTSKEAIKKEFKYNLNYENEQFIYNSASNYFYFSYIPQIPVMLVGRILDLKILTIYYIGKIFTLLFYLLAVWFTIRIIPFGKIVILVIALLPNTLQMCSSYSSDSCSNILSFVFIGILLNLFTTNDNISIKKTPQLLILIFISWVLGTIKPVYFPMVLLVTLIPLSKFENKKEFYFFNTICIIGGLFCTGLWLYLISKINAIPPELNSNPNFNPGLQLQNLFYSPLKVLTTFYNTFSYFWGFYWQSSVGILGYLDTMLNPWIYKTFYWMLFVAILFDFQKNNLKLFQSLSLFFIGIGIIFSIFFGLYVYTPTNDFIVSGIQGRYFTPGLICIFLSFNSIPKINLKLINNKLSLTLLFILLFFLMNNVSNIIYKRYY